MGDDLSPDEARMNMEWPRRAREALIRDLQDVNLRERRSAMRWIVVADHARARIITVTRGRVRELCRLSRDDAARLVERACAERRLEEVATVMEDEHLAQFRSRLVVGSHAVRVHVRLSMFDAPVEEIEGRVTWAAFQSDRAQSQL